MLDWLLPEATTIAARTDLIFIAMVAVSGLVLALVFGLICVFVVRYRHNSPRPRNLAAEKSWRWEISWTAGSLLAFVALFFWGADLYARIVIPPADTMDIFVVGKQWMWKVQHPGGQREINELHVPLGRSIRLILTSQDVIHSFFVPAFRVKRDVVPGRYEQLWFRPTETGSFALFCSEFCGVDHARMAGRVIVMQPEDYARWLVEQRTSDSMAAEGEKLFNSAGCGGCHGHGSVVHAPDLADVYGNPVHLADGRTVIADDRYIHDCIMLPSQNIPAGFPPLMPSFAGQLNEGQVLELIAYIKTLHAPRGRTP